MLKSSKIQKIQSFKKFKGSIVQKVLKKVQRFKKLKGSKDHKILKKFQKVHKVPKVSKF